MFSFLQLFVVKLRTDTGQTDRQRTMHKAAS